MEQKPKAVKKKSEKGKIDKGLNKPRSKYSKPRGAVYYHLSEKDHAIIKKGLSMFVSVYQIALKIGCGYTTLKLYIKKHPELLEVQKAAYENMTDFTVGKLMQKIGSGNLGAMCFYLERKAGWTNRQQVENIGNIPVINMGIIPDSELPQDGLGEPEQLSEVPKAEKPPEAQPEDYKEKEPEEEDNDDEVEDDDDEPSGESDDWDDNESPF